MNKEKKETNATETAKSRTSARKSAEKEPVMYVGPTVMESVYRTEFTPRYRKVRRSCSRKSRSLETSSFRFWSIRRLVGCCVSAEEHAI